MLLSVQQTNNTTIISITEQLIIDCIISLSMFR